MAEPGSDFYAPPEPSLPPLPSQTVIASLRCLGTGP